MAGDDIDKNYSMFLKNGDLLARAALQGIDNEILELAIIIVKKYQGQGYGKRLLRGGELGTINDGISKNKCKNC